jgi:hypothetical protein
MARIRMLAMLFAALASLLGKISLAEPAIEEPRAKARGDGASEESKFIRVRRGNDERAVAMETAVVRYTSKTKPDVIIDLVGAVHIADRSYYDDLNKLFEKYDVCCMNSSRPKEREFHRAAARKKVPILSA